MSKEDFLGLIQGEEFRKAVQASFVGPEFTKAVKASFADPEFAKAVQLAVAPQFEALSDEMADFRDHVLMREDQTIGELKGVRQELAMFGNRLTRVEQHVGLVPAAAAR